jgi:hypothetical protein
MHIQIVNDWNVVQSEILDATPDQAEDLEKELPQGWGVHVVTLAEDYFADARVFTFRVPAFPEPCIHPGVFAIDDAPTQHCHRCDRDIPRSLL